MSKNLKHYRRKKFFYRWFLRRDPRGGAMFGLAWTMMVQALVPFGIFAALRMAGTSFIVTALRMSESFLIFAVLLVTVFLTLYLYGTLVCIFGLAGMLRRTVRPSWLRELMAFFGGWFPQLLGLVLLPTLIRKRRFAAIAFALLGTALCAAILVRLPLAWSWLGALSYLAALALAEARGKCDRRFLYPLAVAFAAVVFLMGYDVKLQLEVKEEQSALSQELGHSVSTAAFWEREAQGFPVTKEPLKSLIAHTDDLHTPNGSAISREAAKKMLDECRNKRPALVAALDRFLKLPVSHVAHEYPENGLLAGMRMPELSAFRRCAVYLCCVIVADPGNRTTAAAANRALIRLREWQKFHIISHLMGIAIESLRLEALRSVLESGQYSREEFVGLVGAPVDWDRSLRTAFGGEATMFLNCVDHVFRTSIIDDDLNETLLFLRKNLSLPVHIQFLRDTRFALRHFRKVCAATTLGVSAAEKCRRTELDAAEIDRNFYLFSGMLLSALNTGYMRNAQAADTRTMALLAAEVMEYRKRRGKLPDDLHFLPRTPISEASGKPFRYEKTPDGFQLVRDRVEYSTYSDAPEYVYPVRVNGGQQPPAVHRR